MASPLPLVLLGIALSAPGQQPGSQTAAPSPIPAPAALTGSAPSQPDTSQLDKSRLDEANAKIAELKSELQAAKQPPPPPPTLLGPALQRFPLLPIFSSLTALVISTLAVVWAIYVRDRSRKEYAKQKSAWTAIERRINKLQNQTLAPQPAQVAPQPLPLQPQRRETPTIAPARAPLQKSSTIAAVPAPEPVVEPVPDPIIPQPAQPRPAAPTSPERWQKTNDLTADYNLACTLGVDAEDAFQSAYRCKGLSCVNLNDLRKDAQAILRFEESSRGLFLAIEGRAQGIGKALIVPAFGKDFQAARASLEGVFVYDDQRRSGLDRPATATLSGDHWSLDQPGKIGLG